MARIEDLVSQVGDARVRAELADEVAHLKSRRTFGLVFERHIPETVMVPHGTVKAGATVVRRADEGCLPLRVHAVVDGLATVTPLDGAATEPVQVPVAELGLLLTFGEAVFPTLTSLGAVRAGGDAPYHAVINGENLHALELLAAIHEGDVDCIYIDPPYNSGARDWPSTSGFRVFGSSFATGTPSSRDRSMRCSAPRASGSFERRSAHLGRTHSPSGLCGPCAKSASTTS
jgi:adenine-specific DNA-methyltransferase